jgi:lysophospholipase
MAHLEYRTTGGDYSWGRAASRAMKQAIKHADKIQTSVLLLSAGEDALVSAKGQHRFVERNDRIRLEEFPLSRHEIFNANTMDRVAYYKMIFAFMEEE